MTKVFAQITTANPSKWLYNRASRLKPAEASFSIYQVVFSPQVWLVILAATCAVLLMSPINVAIGGYFWDSYLYPDAAWRISNGQKPHIDFFAPSGRWATIFMRFWHLSFPVAIHFCLHNGPYWW